MKLSFFLLNEILAGDDAHLVCDVHLQPAILSVHVDLP